MVSSQLIKENNLWCRSGGSVVHGYKLCIQRVGERKKNEKDMRLEGRRGCWESVHGWDSLVIDFWHAWVNKAKLKLFSYHSHPNSQYIYLTRLKRRRTPILSPLFSFFFGNQIHFSFFSVTFSHSRVSSNPKSKPISQCCFSHFHSLSNIYVFTRHIGAWNTRLLRISINNCLSLSCRQFQINLTLSIFYSYVILVWILCILHTGYYLDLAFLS